MHQLISAEPASDYNLRLLYSDGRRFEVDIRPLIEKGGVFVPLADRELFIQVRVGEGGRFIEWPGDVDLCADAHWLEAQASAMDEASLNR